MSPTDNMKDYLRSHPRMIGVLFTLMLLISQSGTAAAGSMTTRIGP